MSVEPACFALITPDALTTLAAAAPAAFTPSTVSVSVSPTDISFLGLVGHSIVSVGVGVAKTGAEAIAARTSADSPLAGRTATWQITKTSTAATRKNRKREKLAP